MISFFSPTCRPIASTSNSSVLYEPFSRFLSRPLYVFFAEIPFYRQPKSPYSSPHIAYIPPVGTSISLLLRSRHACLYVRRRFLLNRHQGLTKPIVYCLYFAQMITIRHILFSTALCFSYIYLLGDLLVLFVDIMLQPCFRNAGDP